MSAATAGRTAPSRKEVTHERIVAAAARATRRTGYDGTGVAEIMKEVGLTHGGFYAHFASREAMLAEAADRAGAESVATLTRVAAAAPPQEALPAMIRAYLSKEHVDGVETGCPVAALDRKSTRLNSSHMSISYAVFCLKKKTKPNWQHIIDTTQNKTPV